MLNNLSLIAPSVTLKTDLDSSITVTISHAACQGQLNTMKTMSLTSVRQLTSQSYQQYRTVNYMAQNIANGC